MSEIDDSESVEKLLRNAEDLVEHGHYRASVMEAMTALEERVNEVIFELLESRKGLPENLVEWLKKQTRFKFDDKLQPLGEFALGKTISKGERLWNDYKKARGLRNVVTHTARRIKESDAQFVTEVVKEWLYFLNSAADAPVSGAEEELSMKFLSLYGILACRFRFPKNSGTLPLSIAAQNARRRGDLSVEQVQVIRTVSQYRNRMAHSQSVSAEELEHAIEEIERLLKPMRGIEIDGSPIA